MCHLCLCLGRRGQGVAVGLCRGGGGGLMGAAGAVGKDSSEFLRLGRF